MTGWRGVWNLHAGRFSHLLHTIYPGCPRRWAGTRKGLRRWMRSKQVRRVKERMIRDCVDALMMKEGGERKATGRRKGRSGPYVASKHG